MESRRKTDPDLGLFIYSIISKSNHTIIEIADFLEVDERTVNYYCTGDRRPNQIRLLKLLKFLEVEPQSIPF